MEPRLLRTLSDNGEPLMPAQHTPGQTNPAPIPLAGVLDMFVEGPLAGEMVDQQLRVSSPASESSKAGEYSNRTLILSNNVTTPEYSCVQPYTTKLNVFSFPLFTESDCEGSGAMGDEDEGFDEEFCDSEETPLRPAASNQVHQDLPPLNLQELNSTDLQSILIENSLADSSDSSAAIVPPFPTPSLLDDIDPGVFMTDMEQSLLGVEAAGKSPIHSPFPLSSPAPVCATLNSMTLGDNQMMVGSPSPMDEWGTHSMLNYPSAYSDVASSVGGVSEYGSTVDVCASSQYLFPLPSPSSSSHSSAGQQYNLDMLQCNQHPQQQATPYTCHSPSPSPSYHHSPSHLNFVNSYNGGGSPSHSSLPPTPPPSSFPHSPSPYQSTHNYQGDPLVSGQFTLMHGGVPSPNPSLHGASVTTSNNFSSCSTQTPLNQIPSPAPSPSHAHTHPSDNEPKRKPTPKAPQEEKLVHMPFYKFRKILDSPSVPEQRKTNIKSVRRRGKNKIAAKNCRQRKQELVLGLQQEIDQLKRSKDGIFVKKGALEREIEQLKSQCLAMFHRNKQTQLPH